MQLPGRLTTLKTTQLDVRTVQRFKRGPTLSVVPLTEYLITSVQHLGHLMIT